MLRAVVEVALSLLAVFGLYALGWLCFGRLLEPDRGLERVYAVIPASGDGGSLEMAVKRALWLRSSGGEPYTVVIADRGLDSRGRSVAGALMAREPCVVLCRPEELEDYCV